MSEVEIYKQRLDTALNENPEKSRPIFAAMRHTVIYDQEKDSEIPVKAAMRQLGQFENLFKNLGDVKDGFPRQIDLSELTNREEYNPQMLQENLLFGTPEQAIKKLQDENFRVYGLAHGGDGNIFDLEEEIGNVAIIVGSEGKGLRRLTREKVDQLIEIPINPESESLNVSNAASISMFQLQKNIIKN